MKLKKGLAVIVCVSAVIIGAKIVASAESLPESSDYDEYSVSLNENSDESVFVTGNDGRAYYNSDEISEGITEINGEEYYIAPNGAVKTCWQTVDGIRMFFDPETGARINGWIEYNNELYYSDPELGKLTCEQTIDGKNYIFDHNGQLGIGWFEFDGCKYYSGDDGEVRTGDCEIDGIEYHFSSKGKYQSGWQTTEGKRIFYDYETAKPIYGWIHYNGLIYYSNEQSGKLNGEQTLDGDIYRFAETGYLLTGFQEFSDGVRLYYDDGTIAKGLCKYGEKKYFFNEKGIMQKGIQEINGKKYYFGSDGSMQIDFVLIDGKTYYFGKDGVMKTGWLTLSSKKYYFNADGIMVTGLVKIGSDTYYFGKDGMMKTGWQKFDSQKRYFKQDGKMAIGLVKIGSDSYYFDSSGYMKTGWQTVNGKKQYFDSNGALKKYVPKVFVGVGHGGYDPGAIGYIVEKEYTLKTGKLVAQYLEEAGVEILMSRDADIDTTMESKLKLCLDYDPDLIVDIHFNAGGGNGFEVYYSMYGGMSLTLANNINNNVSKFMSGLGCQTFIRDGKDRFMIIRETNAPAVLLEGGYVDNWSDAEFIKSHYQQLARAYADGILKTLEMMFN